MPITTSFPGVYVEEDHSLSMSISSGKTCVPLFIFDPFVEDLVNINHWGGFDFYEVVLSIESWMDYISKLGPMITKLRKHHTSSIFLTKNEMSAETALIKKSKFFATESYYRQMNALGYFALQHYFENGGGPCYLYLSMQEPNALTGDRRDVTLAHYKPKTEMLGYDTLLEDISNYPTITTVCLGASAEINAAAYKALSPLFSQTAGEAAPIFCVAGSESKTVENNPYSVKQQTATYYPYLKTNYSLSLNDLAPENIIFEGYNFEKNAPEFEKSLTHNLSKMLADAHQGPEFAKEIIKLLERPVILSPVFAVLGAYCKTDNQRGVWKAPANVVLSGVKGLCDASGAEVSISDTVNADLVDNGINAIRYFPNQGYTIWGARTMVPKESLEWRYIPVRRLFNIAERDIKLAMSEAVFEPNTPATWEIIRSAVDVYLHNLWKQGALFGDKPEQAYFVKVGLGTTMTKEDIDAGKMIIKVGMAAVHPAEFIILEFSQKQI